MTWLRGILDNTPEDRLIVLMHHLPFVSFIDSNTGRHRTDNLAEIHALLAGRPAVSFSGHTHTFEYLAAGAWYAGWADQVGVTRLPFDHVVGGAPSGNWYQGDLGFDGTPMAFPRSSRWRSVATHGCRPRVTSGLRVSRSGRATLWVRFHPGG